MEERIDNETVQQIDLISMLKDIGREWLTILLLAIAAALFADIWICATYQPEYRTSTTFVVTAKGMNNNIYQNLNSTKELASQFTEILGSNVLKKKVAQDLGMNNLNVKTSVDLVPETNLITFSVKAGTAAESYRVLQSVMENYNTVSDYAIKNVIIETIQQPSVAMAPINPLDEKRTVMKVFVVAAGCLIALLAGISYIRDTIKNPGEVSTKLDTRLLGTIAYEKKSKALSMKRKKDYLSMLIQNPLRSFAYVESSKMAASRVRSYMDKEDSRYLDQKVCCVIDDNRRKIGRYILGIRVVGDRHAIKRSVERYGIEQIIIAIPSAGSRKLRPILDICKDTGCELKILPGMYQLVTGEVNVSKLRPVNIEDLLGREEINVNIDEIMDYVCGKTILVTGGGGSIGSELCRQIAAHKPERLIIFDIYENNAYDIQQELKMKYPNLKLTVLIGSIRDEERVDTVLGKYRPDIIYHAAAHKHVPLMEASPNEAIKNNVLGTYNLVLAADRWKVKKFVQISTDKAVNPTNIMGASKRVCEMIIQSFNRHSKTDFVAVRFGNVLGSNGSVIPLFKKQIAAGGPVTVTDPEIIRYFMTISEAVSLVLQAGVYAKGGEIFVLDMGEPVKILDLARNMIRLSGYVPGKDIAIEFTGLRPGEKLYEELLMDEEGMTETPNKLIHIGHPIDVDEDRLYYALRVMKEAAANETDDMRLLMQSIVSTYHIKTEENQQCENLQKAI